LNPTGCKTSEKLGITNIVIGNFLLYSAWCTHLDRNKEQGEKYRNTSNKANTATLTTETLEL